jgi:hypothetical protein
VTSSVNLTSPALASPIRDQNNILRTTSFIQREVVPTSVTENISSPQGTTSSESSSKDSSSSTSGPTSVSELLNNNEVVPVTTTPVNDNNLENEGALNIVPGPKSGQAYVDITEYLTMPQSEAAKKLCVPTSTLSKRWKEAVRGRKWPYRMVCKLDKEIMTLLHNIPQGPGAPPLPEDVETTLGLLIRKRSEELKPVVIRL